MRVAVVGAGVFGATAALELAQAGATVDLYDARGDILDGATSACQARLHRGYHYPRSDATAATARDTAPVFEARFPGAIRRKKHHYVIADDSRVSADEYLAFCNRLGLAYEVVTPPQVYRAQVCVQVPESFVDVAALRRLLHRDLRAACVDMRYHQRVDPWALTGYDLVVAATYGQPWSRPLRYEICEIVYVQIGRYGKQDSFVILDGEYSSLDPVDHPEYILYDVKHTVHAANVGMKPEIPDEYVELLSRPGRVETPLTRFEAMANSAGRYLRALQPKGRGVCIYAGSRFSIRAVLPDVDATDERPTLIERDGNVISILSGKICTAVTTAQKVAEMALVPA